MTRGFFFQGATEKTNETKSAGFSFGNADALCCGLGGRKDSSPPIKHATGSIFDASKRADDTKSSVSTSKDPKPNMKETIISKNSLFAVSSEETADETVDLLSAEAKKAAGGFDFFDTK